MTQQNQNWAGNYTYQARETLTPATLAEAQNLVANSPSIKALGTRHCFNDIADTPSIQLSLAKLNRILSLDESARKVTFEGGVRYGELGAFLHSHGYALPNLASLPHISVAGAIATATHGSGVRCGNLATSVNAIEFITADGTLKTFSRTEDPDTFLGAVVNLGALGIVSKITLDIEPTFQVRQDLYLDLPLATALDSFEAIVASAYSVSLFTDWGSETFRQVWLKTRLDQSPDFLPPPNLFGATLATENQNPVPGQPSENATDQLGSPGPWHERIPHFKLDFTPSSGAELQTEYFVPRQHAPAALAALFALREKLAPLVFITEIRTIAADTLWLSPCYQQDSMAIHFTWKPEQPTVESLLPQIEAALAPFQPRPHWGKLFTLPAETIAQRLPKFAAFAQLAHHLDPQGKFQNPYLKRLLKN